MASDRAIGRYRRWYARLLRLYPRPFRERFAEPMAQTFTDLCRERTDTNRGLHAFALATFVETAAQILRENMTQLVRTRTVIRWALITATVLAVPALAMVFRLGVPDPGSSGGTDGVNWGPNDFAIIGALVFGSGLLYEYASARAGNIAQKAAVGIAVAAGLFLVWVNLAVGMMDVENGNLIYVLVLFVALVGAAIARFEPREASIAMFATAAAQALVAVVALIAGLGFTGPITVFFTGLWLISAWLFRKAAREQTPAGAAP